MESIDSTSYSSVQSSVVPFDSEQFASTFRTSAQSSSVYQQDSFWTRFWDSLFNSLIPRSEPKIAHKIESDGNEYYEVYDPMTGYFRTFGSELETLIWLDRRF